MGLLYARAALQRGPMRGLAAPVALLTWAWLLLIGADIPKRTRIGKGLRLPHGGRGVILHPETVIGEDVTIYHRVTIGVRGTSNRAPTIGDGVYIGTGATIIGEISVGENAHIGAGAVVIDNVPPNTTATGVPARVTPRRNHGNRDSQQRIYEQPHNDHPSNHHGEPERT